MMLTRNVYLSVSSLVILLFSPIFALIVPDDENYCRTPKNTTGNCVPIKECPFMINKIKNQANSPLTHEAKSLLRSYQCDAENVQVCCPLNFDSYPDQCGKRIHVKKDPSVETKRGDYPWSALLAYKTEKGMEFLCGGTLINESYVLTSAACVQDLAQRYKLLSVRLGEHDLNNDEDGAQDVTISEIIPHPRYDPISLENNMGLIRLDTPVNLVEDHIWPLCLPFIRTGTNVHVSGWGLGRQAIQHNELRTVRYEVIDLEECKEIYKSVSGIKINNYHICVRKQSTVDPDIGEFGDPLLWWEYDTQLGVLSFNGPKIQISKPYPKVFTKIFPYMSWILDNIKKY